MSISQVKKQFEAFAGYLGRDETGLERLKTLKDAVNEVRTQLTEAKRAQADTAALLTTVKQRAAAAEQFLAESRREHHRLQQIAENLTRQLAAANEQKQEEEPVDEAALPKGTGEEREVKAALKQLRTKLRWCPPCPRQPKMVAKSSGFPVVDREAIAVGWSHDALWTLGAAVATIVALDGELVLKTSRLFRDIETDVDPNDDAGVGRFMVQWFGRYNINADMTTEKSGGVRLTNLNPHRYPDIPNPALGPPDTSYKRKSAGHDPDEAGDAIYNLK